MLIKLKRLKSSAASVKPVHREGVTCQRRPAMARHRAVHMMIGENLFQSDVHRRSADAKRNSSRVALWRWLRGTESVRNQSMNNQLRRGPRTQDGRKNGCSQILTVFSGAEAWQQWTRSASLCSFTLFTIEQRTTYR